MPASVSTPDWKLKSFEWLPLDRWTVDVLFNLQAVNNSRYCKICDTYVRNFGETLEAHIELHKRQELDRRERIKTAAAAEREAVKQAEREEKGLTAPQKPETRTINTPAAEDGSLVGKTIEEAVRILGEATVASLSAALSLDVQVVRNKLKTANVDVVGHVKSGGRGRPAVIYGPKGGT